MECPRCSDKHQRCGLARIYQFMMHYFQLPLEENDIPHESYTFDVTDRSPAANNKKYTVLIYWRGILMGKWDSEDNYYVNYFNYTNKWSITTATQLSIITDLRILTNYGRLDLLAHGFYHTIKR